MPAVPEDLQRRFDEWSARGRPPQEAFGWKKENWQRYLGRRDILETLPNPINRACVLESFRLVDEPASALDAYIASYLWGYATAGFGPDRAERVRELNTDAENGEDRLSCTRWPASQRTRAGPPPSSTSWTNDRTTGSSSPSGGRPLRRNSSASLPRPPTRDFFALFDGFKEFAEFFHFQDLVTTDYEEVQFYLPFDNFKRSGTPATTEEYVTYRKKALEFIAARKRRMAEWV